MLSTPPAQRCAQPTAVRRHLRLSCCAAAAPSPAPRTECVAPSPSSLRQGMCAAAAALILSSLPGFAHAAAPREFMAPQTPEVIQVEEEIAAGLLLVGLPIAGALRIAASVRSARPADAAEYSVSGVRHAVDITPKRSAFLDSFFAPNVDPNAPVSSVMTSSVIRGRPSQTVSSALAALGPCSGLVVVDEQDESQIVGVFSKHDLPAGGAAATDTLAGRMTTPALTVAQGTSVSDVAALMLQYEVQRLPVTDARGRLVGIVTRSDVFQALLSKYRSDDSKAPKAAKLARA